LTTQQLQNRVAWISGAASGLGAATAIELARRGARVVCADLNFEGAQNICEKILDEGNEALASKCDTRSREENSRSITEAVENFGGLHIAYLNAGIGALKGVLDTSDEEWQRMIDINLTGVFRGLQCAANEMKEGGSIIATSSIAGIRGTANLSAYTASKHGVLGLVKSAAADLAIKNIRVNAVCPGVIDTPILGPVHQNSEQLEQLFSRLNPMKRVGQPEEVAKLVAFLASDEASFITGNAYNIDAGASQVLPFV
jgi:NAD(P)-dependent dehydrogenase (short-subunit alcohol dehydrogenase family)|tara:strand:- start:1739 stop:2506 length:768 start_codon:yes stop_codon:yes gene_type:complete